MFLFGIAILIVSFYFVDYDVANQLIATGQGNLTYIMIGLRNCGISGAVTIIAVSLAGLFAYGFQNMSLIVLYVVGCVIAIITLIVTAIVPLVYAAIIAVECLEIQIICCPSTNPSCSTYVCKYDVNTIDYFCGAYFNKLYFIVAAFFFLSILSLVNSIMGCVAACTFNRVEKQQTTVVVQNAPAQAMMMQPYPGQPYPGQPMMGQPMMGQPMMGQPMMGQPMMGQPYPDQTMMGQPYPNQPYPNQPMMGQPYPDQPMMGQPYPNQPMMGQPTMDQPMKDQPTTNYDYTTPPQNLPVDPPQYPNDELKKDMEIP